MGVGISWASLSPFLPIDWRMEQLAMEDLK
jgi:hypothetical protein